jgi:hypothetical protein
MEESSATVSNQRKVERKKEKEKRGRRGFRKHVQSTV